MTKKYYTQVLDTAIDPFYYGGGSKGFRHTYEKSFDTYEEAVKAAKKTAANLKEDVVIYTEDSIVKFPEMDFEVEKVS